MITEVQKILLDMLDEIIEICTDRNYEVYPYRETALMAYRNQGFETGTQLIELLMPVSDLIGLKNYIDSAGIPGRAVEDHFGNMKIKDAKVNYVNTETTYYDFGMDKNRRKTGLHITIYPLFYAPDTAAYAKYENMWNQWLMYLKVIPRVDSIPNKLKMRMIGNNPGKFTASMLDQLVKSQNECERAEDAYVMAGFKDRKALPGGMIRESTSVEFENRKLKFPGDANAFFTPLYGDEWESKEFSFEELAIRRVVDINLPYRYFIEACDRDGVNIELSKLLKQYKESKAYVEEVEVPLRHAWSVITEVGATYVDE